MDFNDTVDPALQTLFLSLSSTVEYFTQQDFDLFTDGPILVRSSPGGETLQPSQLSESSPIWPSSSAMRPGYSSCDRGFQCTASQSQLPHEQPHPSHDDKMNDHAGHHKRHQTKLACSWCRKLSKKCDAQRPCGRCAQFNRCSECIDAPRRRSRAKGIDRGTYKTRELAVKDSRRAVNRREAYIANQLENGRQARLGLTPDEIQKSQIRSGKMEAHTELKCQPLTNDNNRLQRGDPLSGFPEELFTYSTSQGVEEVPFSPSANTTVPLSHSHSLSR
jgi:Fungal Zn(2)-Cys(6) binuclear cluster domain